LIKKILLRGLLLAAVLYALWLAVLILRFPIPSQPPPEGIEGELRGAYHIHSTFSDGKKDVDGIVRCAQEAGLDFVILVDHGRPNHDVLACQGRRGGLLVLAGSELSVSRGHLVGMGISGHEGFFPQEAEGAAYAIRAASGFSVIAHPYSRVPWSWGEDVGYSGMEIISAYSAVGDKPLRILPYLPVFPLKPHTVMLRMLRRPEANLGKWDRLTEDSEIYGYYSVDAHLLYRPLLSLLNLHVLLDPVPGEGFGEARARIFKALREGRFFNSVNAAAYAGGFRFYAEGQSGRIGMGEVRKWGEAISLHVEAPFRRPLRLVLLRNGGIVGETTEGRLTHRVDAPGVYRVEVYLNGRSPLRREVPWILSNPIFVRK
jgi:hypothetical protein